MRAIPAHLAGEDELEVLRGCDVVFSCVDRHAPRSVLNRLAYAALVPVFDMGTGFRVDGAGALVGDAGRVIVVGPGRPCLFCWGVLDPARIREEALSSEDRDRERELGYVDGADVPEPSVMPFNAMVSAAAVVEFLRVTAGFAADATTNRLAFSFSSGSVRRVGKLGDEPCSICRSPGPAIAATESSPDLVG